MHPAAATRIEKEKHPERFCSNPKCLWRVTHRGRSDAGINEYPDTPCPKHMIKWPVAMTEAEYFARTLKAETGLPAETSSPANDRAESAAHKEDKEDAMPKQIQDRFDFQIEAMKVLKKASPERFERLTTYGVMSPSEMEEGDRACEEGGTGEEFGKTLAERDRSVNIEKYAQWIESAPKNQKRATA